MFDAWETFFIFTGFIVLLGCGYLMFSFAWRPTRDRVQKSWLMRFFIIRWLTVWAQTFTPDNGLNMKLATRWLANNSHLNSWELSKLVKYEQFECLVSAAGNRRTPMRCLEEILGNEDWVKKLRIRQALLSNPQLNDNVKTLWALQLGVY